MEHFNRRYAANFQATTFDDYVLETICEPGHQNGIIATKIFWFQLERARKKFAPQLSIEAAFLRLHDLCERPTLVRLIRKDHIRQAISYIRAYKSGVWSTLRGNESPATSVDTEFGEIERWRQQFLNWENCWDQLCLGRGDLQIMTLFYEDIMHCIEQGARSIADYLGIELPMHRIDSISSAIVRHSAESVDKTVHEFLEWQSLQAGGARDGRLSVHAHADA